MTSCGKEIPGDIIQPDKMEEVLYDYHLAIGMSSNLKSSETFNKEAYKSYLFKKHDVTEAEFDSSMVWYTREAQELVEIYQRLDRRFSREHAHAEMLLESRQSDTRLSLPGDTVDVWGKSDLCWLTDAPLSNQLLFEIQADSNYHAKDAFVWSMDYHFLAEGKVTMGFNVIFENDSTVGETKIIKESGNHSICLRTDSAFKAKTLNGFVHVADTAGLDPLLLLQHITLTRYHYKEAGDSISVDNATPEAAPKVEEKPKKNNPKAPQRLSRRAERGVLEEPVKMEEEEEVPE